MRILLGLLIFAVYFASVAQMNAGNSIKGLEKILVTHSHSEPAHEHQSHEHDDDLAHGETPDEHDHEGEHEASHTHVFFVAASPLHASPNYTTFIAFEFNRPEYPRPQSLQPPLAPGLGSIFRPPIAS